MDCLECGGSYQERQDLLEVADPYVGPIIIQGVPYFKCSKCDDILYTEETSRAIEAERNRLVQEMLRQLPMGDFMTAAQTASTLGISRQALHKHRRINHGFIFQTKFGGVTIYLRQSVLQFKKIGDGRFQLCSPGYDPSQYVVKNNIHLELVKYDSQIVSKPGQQLFHNSRSISSLEETAYAN